MKKLALDVEIETDGSYLVSDTYSLEYGIGDTLQAAIIDYMISLLEYFDILDDYGYEMFLPKNKL